jgi:hypothetical protein
MTKGSFWAIDECRGWLKKSQALRMTLSVVVGEELRPSRILVFLINERKETFT